ncbi:MAG: LacI family DNA-binding transcriptional regulator [Hyphomicrobiales bacterium]
MRKRLQERSGARPTVSDVARAAGVSTATVSRVLNASAEVSETLKTRVTETMEQLGYVRDASARALATRRSFRLGIIIPSGAGPIVSSILVAFEDSCKTRNFGMLAVRSNWSRADIQTSFRRQMEHGVEGVFAAGPLDDADIVSLTSDQEIALVSLSDGSLTNSKTIDVAAAKTGNGEATSNTSMPSSPSTTDLAPGTIDLALCVAARRLALLLTDMGHRRIAIVTEPHAEAPFCAGLAQGVGQGLLAGGFSGPVVIETTGSLEAGAHVFSALMEQTMPPTAVLCATDIVAVGMYFEAGRRGMTIPVDISIAALTSPPTARAMSPALSGIDIDPTEIGRLAADNLLARIEARPVELQVRLHAGLCLRDSLAPPKSG